MRAKLPFLAECSPFVAEHAPPSLIAPADLMTAGPGECEACRLQADNRMFVSLKSSVVAVCRGCGTLLWPNTLLFPLVKKGKRPKNGRGLVGTAFIRWILANDGHFIAWYKNKYAERGKVTAKRFAGDARVEFREYNGDSIDEEAFAWLEKHGYPALCVQGDEKSTFLVLFSAQLSHSRDRAVWCSQSGASVMFKDGLFDEAVAPLVYALLKDGARIGAVRAKAMSIVSEIATYGQAQGFEDASDELRTAVERVRGCFTQRGDLDLTRSIARKLKSSIERIKAPQKISERKRRGKSLLPTAGKTAVGPRNRTQSFVQQEAI